MSSEREPIPESDGRVPLPEIAYRRHPENDPFPADAESWTTLTTLTTLWGNLAPGEVVATPRGFSLPEGVLLSWDPTEVTRRTNDGSEVLPGRWVVTQEFDRGLASELVEVGCFSALSEALVCCRVTIERARARRAAAACG